MATRKQLYLGRQGSSKAASVGATGAAHAASVGAASVAVASAHHAARANASREAKARESGSREASVHREGQASALRAPVRESDSREASDRLLELSRELSRLRCRRLRPRQLLSRLPRRRFRQHPRRRRALLRASRGEGSQCYWHHHDINTANSIAVV